jgi:hypothetical protein
MAKNDMVDLSNPMDEFEQHGYCLDSADESYRVLLAALDLGWKVEEPVYFRPRWYEGDQWVFHFIIKKYSMGPPRLITIRYSPAIERLVLEEGWQVDRYPVQVKPSPFLKEEVNQSKCIFNQTITRH